MQDLSLAFEAQLPNKLLKTKNLTGAENHSLIHFLPDDVLDSGLYKTLGVDSNPVFHLWELKPITSLCPLLSSLFKKARVTVTIEHLFHVPGNRTVLS